MPNHYEYRQGEELLVSCIIFHTDRYVLRHLTNSEYIDEERDHRPPSHTLLRAAEVKLRSYQLSSQNTSLIIPFFPTAEFGARTG